MRRRLVACLALVLCAASSGIAQINGYYRQPSIHENSIVFVSEGDLWKVDAAGGVAQRLTSNPAEETQPHISPDGRTIAFTGRYDGVGDVYTIPVAGGTPKRHSWDAGAQVVGWTKDGRVIYTTLRYSTLPNAQLVLVNPANNDREIVKLAQAWDGAWDDNTLFFTRQRPQYSNTKRYKGGTAQQIWKWDGRNEAQPLTSDWVGTSRYAKVWNGRVFFTSDRDGVMNIWSMDKNGKNVVQHTFHKDYDVREYGINNGRIVYQQGADLWLLSVAEDAKVPAKAAGDGNGKGAKVAVTIPSDLDNLRDRWVKKPIDFLSDYHLDKTGERVALIARGLVFVAPVGQGRFVQLPNRGGVRYRETRFSPDGKTLYTLNDRSGEVELWASPANGVGAGTQLTNDAKILRWDLEVSADGKYIAHDDKNQRLYVYDVATKNNKLVADSKYGGFGYWWAPDSKALIYTTGAENSNTRIFRYDVASGTSTALTGDRYDSYSPAVTPDGTWLYFLSDRTFNTSVGSPWGARQPEPYFNNQTKIYALQLKRGPRFPFAPKTELDTDTVSPVSAIYEVPIAAGNYSSLATDGKRLYYTTRDDRYAGGNPKIVSLEFKNQDVKAETFAEGTRGRFELSGDNKKILFRKGDDFYVVPAGAKAPSDLASSKVDLSGWLLQLERKDELKNLFVDAWRLERDFFYDANMHGLDWPAMKAKYLPLAERVSDRNELSDVIAQMVGELSALHIYVYGGDLRASTDTIPHASLGARLEKSGDGWKIAHIYQNDPDDVADRSPLLTPGVDIEDGDEIVSIDGVPLTTIQHPAELLIGKAGKQTLLVIRKRERERERERSFIVYPITLSREASLRYSEWQYSRRKLVDRLSGGRIGYVHLRAMGPQNMSEFTREYYPQYTKDALIVDMRNNGGGNIDSWILEKLMRKAWFYWQPRVGEPYWNMQYAFRGPMATIINEWSASDGEAFPEGFRRLGMGKLIGTRTWGGEIWLSSSNTLADRGIATAAETGVYGPEREWLIEGHGVEPDIVVDNMPAATFSGDDAQLAATVKHLLDEIAKRPNPVPKAPAYPKK